MTDNKTTELLPCPFCGGEASKRLFYGTRYGVYCDECDARVGGLFNTEAEAIAAWNTRATHGTLTAEQVRKAIRKYAEDDSCYIFEVYGEMCGPIADELNGMLGSDDEYEVKMDALLCRLTNGKWSKSRAYDLDFMVSCVDEEYETLYAKELAELVGGNADTDDALALLDEIREAGRISYDDYSQLFDVIAELGSYHCGARIRKAVGR